MLIFGENVSAQTVIEIILPLCFGTFRRNQFFTDFPAKCVILIINLTGKGLIGEEITKPVIHVNQAVLVVIAVVGETIPQRLADQVAVAIVLIKPFANLSQLVGGVILIAYLAPAVSLQLNIAIGVVCKLFRPKMGGPVQIKPFISDLLI